MVPGVEADPNHAALTQEALDSFKVFEDVPADSAASQAGAGDAANAAGGDAASAGGVGDDAAAVGGEQGAGVDLAAATLAQEQHHTRAADYDEFGDSLKADRWTQQQQQAKGELQGHRAAGLCCGSLWWRAMA